MLRAAAALTVFLQHCHWLRLDGNTLGWFRWDVGHSAVVIFFVLSGYVIAATLPRSRSPVDYAIKRASRIYSVAIPALLLTLLVDLIMVDWPISTNEATYQLRKLWIYIPLALTFSGELWGIAEPALSNGPYWSLNYEVWYYVLFGMLVFSHGLWRWAGVLLVLVIMGPKLWLLLPIWLGGVLVLHLQRTRPLPRDLARAAVLLAIALLAAVKVFDLEQAINSLTVGFGAVGFGISLSFSTWFLGDMLVGLLTMALVYGLGSAEFEIPPLLSRPMVGLASVSFSLYLVNYPLLSFFGALFPGNGWLAVSTAFVCAVSFGVLFEPQKKHLARALTWLLKRSEFKTL